MAEKLKRSWRRWASPTVKMLVIIVLIGVAWSVFSPGCGGGSGSKLMRVESDYQILNQLLKQFHDAHSRYPTEEEGLRIFVEKPDDAHALPNWQKWMDALPLDPWGQPYRYTVDFTVSDGSKISRTKGEAYRLISAGADGVLGSPDDLTEDHDIHGAVE